jgi:type IV secretion system protein VirD4
MSPPPAPRAPEDPWVSLGLVLAGAVVVLALIVWGVGQLAGIAFGSGAPATGFSEMPGVLARLPERLSDPANAWPAADRARLPGPVGFYGALTLAVATLSGLALAGISLVRRVGGPDVLRRRPPEGARWARARDLRALIVTRSQPGRLTLGRLGRRLVAGEPRASTIVVGPSQSGKTAGLAIPAILEAAGPVLAVSVKRDLLDHTLSSRRDGGPVWVYDPTGAAGLSDPSPVGWDPVRACHSWAGARRMAQSLGSAHGRPGSRDAEFWLQMATKLVGPLLLAAAHTEGASMRDVVRWLDTREENQVADGLRRAGSPEAMDAFGASCQREDRTKSSVYATAEAVLEPFADPGVAASLAGSGVDPVALVEGRGTLYIVAPAADQDRLAPLFAGLVEHVLEVAFARAAAGRPCDPPLLAVLDEAANTAPIRSLPQIASTAAGQGVQVVTIFQDLAQARSRYGEAADTILANHRAKLFLSGISDGRTLEYLGRALGDEEVGYESATRGEHGSASRTRGTRSRRLAPADLVRGIEPGYAILVYGHLPPARLRLRPWFAERDLRRRAERRAGG